MGDKNGKRKKEKHDDDEFRNEKKKSKRARSRSRSLTESSDRDSRRRRRYWSNSPEKPIKLERRNEDTQKESEVKPAPPRKNKETDMLNTRTGGAYIPPARLRLMQAQITDKSSTAYQRLAWEALKKSIHGHINKINVGNIGIIIKELLKENIVRGRGLLCRSVIQAQAASPTFTNVYAALVAAVNSRFPNIGELLLKRLVIQFKRGFKRNDKPICISSASFIAHLVNQRVAHEILALELLTLLVETPTDDSVEVAIAFLKECGQKLTEVSSKGVNAIFEMLRNILHEGQLDKRVQYMIEVMFQVWKDGFKDHPALIEELELVPEEEQFTHLLMLDEATDAQDILNVFKHDEKYEENEQKYKTLCKEILGSDAESDGGEDGSGESGSEESEEDEEEAEKKPMTIIDNTETNLVALRRTIYLTINSSLDFEECAHKLMKIQLKPGQEVELCHMFLDCCAEQRTYEKFYGLLAQRFCNINRIYIGPFEEIFKDSYSTAHRLDTNRLRNVSKFFAHLLFTDSISWDVMECVKLNEEDTTSSSRIYIKILFQELAEYMGLKKLNDRLKDSTLQDSFRGVFPRDNPKNTRFSINFFTSIGLGGLTDELREHLKQMPKNVLPQVTEINLGSSSDSSSSSDSDSSSDSSSSSESDSDAEEESSKKKKKNKDKSEAPKSPETGKAKDKERWGHDGFYDTYGQDARRLERDAIDRHNQRQDREKDNFIRPRDRRDDRTERNRDRHDEREGRTKEDGRERRNDRIVERTGREDKGRHERDKKVRGDDNKNRDDSRREKSGDVLRRSREDERRKDGDSKKKREDSIQEERQVASKKDKEDERRKDDRPREDDRRHNRDDEKEQRDVRRDDSIRKGKRDDDPKRNADERRKDDKCEESDRIVRKENDNDRRRNRDDGRDRRDGRPEEALRKEKRGEERKKVINERRKDDKSEEKQRSRADDDSDRRRDRDSDKVREDSRRNDRRVDGNRQDKEDARRKDEAKEKDRTRDDYSKDDVISRNKSARKTDTKDKRKLVKEQKSKKGDSSDSESDSSDSTSSSSSDKEDRRRQEKENRYKREESRSKRDRRSDKHNRSPKTPTDGWDIRRQESVRREIPTGRYWEQ